MPGANMLGLDVRGLDVPAFLNLAHQVALLLFLVWLAVLVRWKRPAWLLLGVLAANVYVWGITNYPLQRLYGLGPSHDRIANLSLCQVVAAGNSPLRTTQVGQLHFEPFWGLFVAAISGWNTDRVLDLYPFLPILMAAGFAVALYFGLDGGGRGASAWERALVAGFATLLSSTPLDFAGVYRVPWALTFLLKPNHALGLVLLPLLLRAFASIRSVRGRIGAGLLLHLLGWVFVLHMVYVSFGLVVFALGSLVARQDEVRRDVKDVLVVLGINLLVVSPYLYMLFVGYPFLTPSPRMTIHVSSPHLLETTLRHGWIFWLGLWGARVAWRRNDRLGRVWVAQLLGAHLLWLGYLGLSAIQMARERDEIAYWVRFLTAASAGIGAWDLVRRCAEWLERPLSPALRAAAIVTLALPWSLPYWWDPTRMDSYFEGSLGPVPESVRIPTEFLRRHTDPRAVVVADQDLTPYVGALGARRVLLYDHMHQPRDAAQRHEATDALVRSRDTAKVLAAAAPFGIRYLIVTPKLLSKYPGVTLEEMRSRTHLRAVNDFGNPNLDFVASFEVLR